MAAERLNTVERGIKVFSVGEMAFAIAGYFARFLSPAVALLVGMSGAIKYTWLSNKERQLKPA